MGNLTEEVKRAKAQGDKEAVNGFTGAIRSLEILTIEEGDVLVVPTEFKVYEQIFANGSKAQYIFLQIDGTDKVKKFYPGTFTKRRRIYEEDGSLSDAEPDFTNGTASELFRSFQTVEDGMNALKGKKIKVTEVRTIRTKDYTTGNIVNQQIPKIDLV